MIAYTLLGSTWLIMRTEGALQQRMIRVARPFGLMLLGAIVVVSVWTPLTQPGVAARWFSFPNIVLFSPVPLLVAPPCSCCCARSRGRRSRGPFVAALGLIFLGYSGMAISIWPNIVPPGLSIWSASSPPQSQGFALVGTLFILPFILGYTVWSYYVFRGKVKLGEGYH